MTNTNKELCGETGKLNNIFVPVDTAIFQSSLPFRVVAVLPPIPHVNFRSVDQTKARTELGTAHTFQPFNNVIRCADWSGIRCTHKRVILSNIVRGSRKCQKEGFIAKFVLSFCAINLVHLNVEPITDQ